MFIGGIRLFYGIVLPTLLGMYGLLTTYQLGRASNKKARRDSTAMMLGKKEQQTISQPDHETAIKSVLTTL